MVKLLIAIKDNKKLLFYQIFICKVISTLDIESFFLTNEGGISIKNYIFLCFAILV
mgnify:CR=1 FL=1